MKTFAVVKKELKTYFTSPLAYTMIGVFMALSGLFFNAILRDTQEASLRILFGVMTTLLLLLSPVLTMRLVAEEKRQGTDELLLTSPLRPFEIVAGKYAACVILFGVMLALTLQYLIILLRIGKPEMGPVFSGYFGLFLLCCAFASIGLFASALTDNQMVAAVVSFGLLLLFWIMEWLAENVPETFREFVSSAALISHMTNFQKGIIELADVFYFLCLIFIFLFLSSKVIESRRW